MEQAGVNIEPEDLRRMLMSMIGTRFGDRPEEHLDEIRAERRRFAGRFAKMAGISATDTVVDLGSGCGFGTQVLAENALEVVACDADPAYLNVARRECRAYDNVRFAEIRSGELVSVATGSVDAIVSIAVFIHFNLYDIYWHLRECARVLKPGGRICFDFADMDRLFPFRDWDSNTQSFMHAAGYYRDNKDLLYSLMQWNSEKGIRRVARQHGFAFVRRRRGRLLFRFTGQANYSS